MLGPAITVKGQLAWYAGHPRFFVGKDRFGRSFFELIDQQLTLALGGTVHDRPRRAPGAAAGQDQGDHPGRQAGRAQPLVGVLRLLTTEKVGVITVAEDADES